MASSYEIEPFIQESGYITDYRNFLRHNNTSIAERLCGYLQSHHSNEYYQFVHSVSTTSLTIIIDNHY